MKQRKDPLLPTLELLARISEAFAKSPGCGCLSVLILLFLIGMLIGLFR